MTLFKTIYLFTTALAIVGGSWNAATSTRICDFQANAALLGFTVIVAAIVMSLGDKDTYDDPGTE